MAERKADSVKMDRLLTRNFFNLKGNEPFYQLFMDSLYPWEILSGIGTFISELGPALSPADYEKRAEGVFVHRTAKIADYVTFLGACIIGEGVEVRPGAFIRKNVYAGPGSVIGNSTELKNVILTGSVEVPHFNYVGDSILSYGAHMGAGSITSNLRADKGPVKVRLGEREIESGLRKFGAMISEHAEVGCNAVLNPGTMLGRESLVYPLSSVRVSVPAFHIHKNDGSISRKRAGA